MPQAEIIENKDEPGKYVVQTVRATDDEPYEAAYFVGANALHRAQCFAGNGKYYDGWADRTAGGY